MQLQFSGLLQNNLLLIGILLQTTIFMNVVVFTVSNHYSEFVKAHTIYKAFSIIVSYISPLLLTTLSNTSIQIPSYHCIIIFYLLRQEHFDDHYKIFPFPPFTDLLVLLMFRISLSYVVPLYGVYSRSE